MARALSIRARRPGTGVMTGSSKRAVVTYLGRVQGVGFRFTVARIAQEADVKGFVRNQPDGSVALVAEGSPNTIQKFLGRIRASNLGPFIKREDVTWCEASGEFGDFSVRF
jgi:acylphosphatase